MMTEAELTKLTYFANAILQIAKNERWSEQDYTRRLAELALRASDDVYKCHKALQAVKRGVAESGFDGGCPFCSGYVGFDVDDPVIDEQGDFVGHDDGCPWPLVKVALGETQVYKQTE